MLTSPLPPFLSCPIKIQIILFVTEVLGLDPYKVGHQIILSVGATRKGWVIKVWLVPGREKEQLKGHAKRTGSSRE